jgi:hypothetical protein
MLMVDFSYDGVANTVPYPPLFDSVRRNNGFVDVRGRPDLAANIVEGASSAALRKLLVRLAEEDSPLVTLGCDLGEHKRDGLPSEISFAAGGYIQWVLRSPGVVDTDQYESLAETLARSLETLSEGHTWQCSFLIKPVNLKLDDVGLVPSHWIWFDALSGSSPSARKSRERLLGSLHQTASTMDLRSIR